MDQILSSTYLIVLLSFLSIFSYYISGEILTNIQEENTFNVIKRIAIENGEKPDPLLHLNLAKVYSKRLIYDSAIYELLFLIKLEDKSRKEIMLSNLYRLLGQNFEKIKEYNESHKFYSEAIKICPTNEAAIGNLKSLTSKNS
nr:Ycf37 [Porphyrostromium boryanum]